MAGNQTGFPGPPGGINSSPGGTPGMSSPRPGYTGPGTPNQTPPGLPPPPPQMASPSKEYNHAHLCRRGQDLTQDILGKTIELFTHLKALQLPNGVNVSPQTFSERKAKVDEHMRQMTGSMKMLRFCYDKVNESTARLETRPIEDLLPVEENGEMKGEKPKVNNENIEYASEEYRKLVEQVRMKNRQLKEVIDQSRTIVWEINTMMAMRKP